MEFFLGSVVVWGILFLASNLEERRCARERLAYASVANLSMTLLHAAFAISFGAVAVLTAHNIGGANTPLQSRVIAVSLAFFTVDTIAMALLRANRADFYLHHLMCLLVEGYGLFAARSGWEICAAIAIGEMGPCFYVGLLAKRLNVTAEAFYRWNDRAYLFGLLFSRLVLIGWTLLRVLASPLPTLPIKIAGLFFYALGIYWSVALIRKLWRKARPEALQTARAT